ncbi:hypothetical protein SAMN05920897_10194 [Alkalispirochaeta americana]|uniref:Capsule assembly protein Wzi n=1 Tax=Alkalispirochaeta americana TaxID=159291 RepID=A0A1N6N7I1_9SPIO|nr:hypothetical protein [Alkalispirochaeta americana]SIP87992.1 hypothetical protein SAMN05920897_10194 [Alkalispirochaeta americana]
MRSRHPIVQRWCRLAIFLFLASLTGPGGHAREQQQSVPRSGEVRLRLDQEGLIQGRFDWTWGPVRWFGLGSSEIMLQQEEAAPAGYQQKSVSLRSPLEDLSWTMGVQAGPLLLGPIRGRGIYHRFLDPTAGGVRWGALSEDSRFVPALHEGAQDRLGAALSFGGGAVPLGLDIWYLAREDRYQTEGLRGWFDLWPGGSAGRVGVLLSRVTLDEQRLRPLVEEGWLFPSPPLREPQGERQAITWELDRRRRPGDDGLWARSLGPRALIEMWRYQGGGTVVPRLAGTASASAGPPVLRWSGRVSAAERGFRTVEGGRPRYSRFSSLEAAHRSIHRATILEGHVRWAETRGWQEEQPGPQRQELDGLVSAGRLRLAGAPFLDRVALAGTVRQYPREEIATLYRGEARLHLRSPGGGVRFRVSGGGDSRDQRSLAGVFSLLAPLGARRRSLSVSAAGRVQWDSREGPAHWYGSLDAGVPLGKGWRFIPRVRVDQDVRRDDPRELTGSITLEGRF